MVSAERIENAFDFMDKIRGRVNRDGAYVNSNFIVRCSLILQTYMIYKTFSQVRLLVS